MRYLRKKYPPLSFVVLLVVLIVACTNENRKNTFYQPKEHFQRVDFELPQPFGQISIFLPQRYDTVFHWVDYSDCSSCHKVKYRAQPKHFIIQHESGFISEKIREDSIERFTINHHLNLENLKVDDKTSIKSTHKQLTLANMNFWQEICMDCQHIKFDTITQIGSHTFSVFGLEGYDSIQKRWTKFTIAKTYIHGNSLEFRFELSTKRNDEQQEDFFKNSMYYLQSIQFKTH